MTEGENISVFETAWYWRLFSIVDVIISIFLIWGALCIEHPTAIAKGVLLTVGALALLLGLASWVYFKTYTISVGEQSLVVRCFGMQPAEYLFKGLIGVRKKGFYITLDYGVIPRKTLLALTVDNTALFYALSRKLA